MKFWSILIVTLLLAVNGAAQLKLVEGSFEQISNLDADNPNEWGDIDAHLLTREDRTDENGVKNALIKLKVDKISREDMKELSFITDQGIACKWIHPEDTPGEMWLLVTGMTTDFKVMHPIFGESNSMTLKLKGLCSYTLKLTNNETTTLTVLSEPEGANIYLDGNWMGHANGDGCVMKQVTFGEHTLKAVLDGVEDEMQISVSEASQRSYKLEVYKERTFSIHTDPQGAAILVDGKEVGVSPLTLPLKLKFHTVEARKDGEYSKVEKVFDEQMPNTLTLTVKKHKNIQIAAMRSGGDVEASVHVDDRMVGYTPHTTDLEYGRHDLVVTYGSKVKRKTIRVNDGSPTYYRFKFPARKNFTWPWDKDYKVRPVGLSMAYVQKTLMQSWDDIDNYEDPSDFFGEDNAISGIQAGLLFQPQFKYGFGMSFGLYYEYYWDKSEDQLVEDEWYGNYTAYMRYKEHSLYIPIGLEYRLVLAENFSLFVNGGFGFDIGLGGAVEAYEVGADEEPFYKNEDIYGEEFINQKRFNVSYEYGGGIQIFGLQMAFKKSVGLLQHSREDGYSLKVEKPMMISLSYVFGGD